MDSDKKPGRYDFAAIETRWQRYWEEHATFRTLNPGEQTTGWKPVPHSGGADATKPKYYILDMFPYPSGAGLHVGHPIGYCATDIVTRYKRMRGFNVLHPMGFDAFGLPAEQYAIETNVHPAVTTQKNIEMYRRQLKMFGFSYDWGRELATSDPGYYRWTQWMFARMHESWYDESCEWAGADGGKVIGRARPIAELIAELESGRWGVDASLGLMRSKHVSQREWAGLSQTEKRRAIDRQRLAFIDEVPVNWCPALGTVLSNEEVDNEGRSDRGSHQVYRRPLRQWMLRITKYAERLLSDLDELDWPEPIKLMQRNWVGRSVGAEVVFPLADPPIGGPVAPTDHCSQSSGTQHRVASAPRSDSHVAAAPCSEWADAIRVYTTRPDTLFGATYMVLAPEYPLVERITTKEHRGEVTQYVEAAKRKSDMTRTAESKEKTGVFTGAYAINPVNGERIPIWIADYVLMGYGTGAIMAVPGSDERDFEFAFAFDLPIVAVVKPTAAWIEERIAETGPQIDRAAAEGFEQFAREAPERAESIDEQWRKFEGLGDMTVTELRDRVGVDQLIEYYVKNPRSWRAAFCEESTAVNSPAPRVTTSIAGKVCSLNGLSTQDAKKKITAWLEANGLGRAAVNFKLRDWLFSRQRYWGEPFPVLHGEDGETVALRDDELPLELPPMKEFKPTPSEADAESLPTPPLGRAPAEWRQVTRDGISYRRDVNTMPQWAGSCWYYLRFIDPRNSDQFCDPAAERYWMPIDLYVGGAEHAVLHLLYARFWHKVFFDLGFVSTREPFRKLFNQGMIQSFAYRDRRGIIVGPDAVEERGDDRFVLKNTNEPVERIVAKMSKALRNVVNPDDIIAQYGADTFRLYEMYMGPLETSKPWNTRDVPGLFKLCQRIWRLFVDESSGELSPAMTNDPPDAVSLRAMHKMIKRVTEDIEALKFNTSIAAMFDFVNVMTPLKQRSRAVLEPFVLVLAPFAPHLAEELWSRLGHAGTLTYEAWPTFEEKLTRDEQIEIAVQVGGKIKSRVMVAAEADEASIQAAALADPKVVAAIGGKAIRKVIVAKGRLVNILV
jgi:leucyl-tRNA synthetase